MGTALTRAAFVPRLPDRRVTNSRPLSDPRLTALPKSIEQVFRGDATLAADLPARLSSAMSCRYSLRADWSSEGNRTYAVDSVSSTTLSWSDDLAVRQRDGTDGGRARSSRRRNRGRWHRQTFVPVCCDHIDFQICGRVGKCGLTLLLRESVVGSVNPYRSGRTRSRGRWE